MAKILTYGGRRTIVGGSMRMEEEVAVRELVMTSPIGMLRIQASRAGVHGIRYAADETDESGFRSGILLRTAEQLDAYFEGDLTEFELPLAPQGTPFQQSVWRHLLDIPYGRTTTYGEIARRLDLKPGAARAVGLANGANPISIVIPCHRVIGADGSLTGYAGGLPAKRFLLDLEQRSVGQQELF